MSGFFSRLVLAAVVSAAAGCAQLHHAQIGDLDLRDKQTALVPFSVKVSEVGISFDDATAIGRAVARNNAQVRAYSDANSLFYFINMGPRTGNVVFDPSFPDDLSRLIAEQCPGGHVTDLIATRESRRYPVISGEIVKITGFCAKSLNITQSPQAKLKGLNHVQTSR